MEKENNNLLAIVCSLIGGLIATIPWVLVYVYGNMILSLLAIIIAMGALKGYKLVNRKINKSLPTIIVIISVISVTIATFIFIPIFLLVKEGSIISIDSLKELYEYNSFTNAIIKDYIVSLLFTFLGISGVISNIKNELNTGKTNQITNKDDLARYNYITKDEIEIVSNAFEKVDAFEKYNAKEKSEIISFIKDINAEYIFNKFLKEGIIKKYHKKYYYSKKNANNPEKRVIKKYLKLHYIPY